MSSQARDRSRSPRKEEARGRSRSPKQTNADSKSEGKTGAEKKPGLWPNARTVVMAEADGQHSIFIHVPGYLKSYPEFKEMKNFLADQKWPEKRTPSMGTVMPHDIVWDQTEGKSYSFSRKEFKVDRKWPDLLDRLGKHLNEDINQRTASLRAKYPSFKPAAVNSVLTNRYLGGRDSISAHSDNEPLFGPNPTIVSLSYGATRTFYVRRKSKAAWEDDRKWSHLPASVKFEKIAKHKNERFVLKEGDLLIMGGSAQCYTRHGVDKIKPKPAAASESKSSSSALASSTAPTSTATLSSSAATGSSASSASPPIPSSIRWNQTWRCVV